jgi:deoxyribodipyrimidine photo-lyase
LDDHAALRAAVARGGPVVPVYIWSPREEGAWAPGAASRWWLHQSLRGLDDALRRKGSRLILRRGRALAVLRELVRETGADAVFWGRRYEPASLARDGTVERGLARDGVTTDVRNAALLFEPWEIQTQDGQPYKVFTPFWKRCLQAEEPAAPQAAPRKIPSPRTWPASDALTDLALEPEVDWTGGIRKAWAPGPKGAARNLDRFLDDAVAAYDRDRNLPGRTGTSRLSPHLHFGEISPRAVWHAVHDRLAAGGKKGLIKGGEVFLSEVGWREFAHHLLYHFPHTTGEPLRPEFKRFPWERNAEALRAWQKGRTGYPIVDAGMRELWTTGWMHNRVRMIVASFLVKDLLLPWQEGAKWFWDTLVDADLANNTLGWQWTAGCGADAAPYFRVFNPILQGERFDPKGDYVRRHVPELKALPDRFLHKPWQAPAGTLEEAGVVLGKAYPRPLVDHGEARDRALGAYDLIVAPKG